MKRIAILTAVAALIMGTAAAQESTGQQRPERKQLTPEQIAENRVESLGKTLELTDEQKEQIYQIYLDNATEQQKEMEALRKVMEEQREKQQERQQALDEQMQKILDASQYKKWSKQQQAQQNRGRSSGQGGFQRQGDEGGFGGPGGGGFDNGMGF